MAYPDERDRRESPASLPAIVDTVTRKIVTGIVIAGAFVALAIYSRPGPPRYQAFITGDGIVRIDTRRGNIIACQGQRCYTIVRPKQRLERSPAPEALSAPQPQRALPAPAGERAPTPPAPPTAPAAQ